MQYVEKMYAPRDAAKTAEYMNALKEKYIALEEEKNPLIARHNKDKYDIPDLEYRAESLEEHAGNIEVLRSDVERLQEYRRDLRLFDVKKKKDADEKIAQATQELDKAQDFFKNNFHVDPSRAAEELERLQEEIRAKKEDLNAKKIIVTAIRERQAAIELEYHTQKLLAEIRPDREQIDRRLEQLRKTPETVRDRLTQEQIERQLNTIESEHFQAVINNLPPYQARILTEEHTRAEAIKREQEKARERENEKNRAIDRSR
jgi:DNA repair exonuclease SbcCD ATPase subunit